MKKLQYKGDICIITSPSNLFYLSEYRNADAILIFYEGKSYYFTDSRYFEEVQFMRPETEICNVEDIDRFIAERKVKSASIESTVAIKEYLRIKKLGIEELFFIDTEINNLRRIKSEKELATMKKAQEITDEAFEKVLSEIKEGITEKELASKLEAQLFLCGGEALAFDSIVAFGKNTSKPHAHRGNTKLEKGMPVTMDFGAKHDGYCSDMTRTVFFGKPEQKIIDTYNLVLEAQTLALSNIKTGMTGMECDSIARGHFAKYGLDKYFVHTLGHSLGIDIHEYPLFSRKCDTVMQKGMVLSVEPGLYFPDEFGIRIEDVIYFDENEIINLTKSPKNIIIL